MSAASQGLSGAAFRPGRLAGQTPAGRAAGYIFLIALALVSIGPLVWMVLTSLKPASEVFNGPLLPQHPQLNAYGYVIGDLGIGSYFLNSVIVTSIAVCGVIIASSLAGYAFAFLPLPAKRVVFGVLMSALLLPAALFLIPAFIELKALGLLDTQLGLALVHTGAGVPFAIFLMRSFFENIPNELRDAARMDGASEFTIFFRVALPLSLPGVATVAIFQVLFTWNDLMLSNGLIQNQSIQTLQPALYTLVGEHSSNWPALTAALAIAAAPVVIFFVAIQRLFVAGLLAGSVKG